MKISLREHFEALLCERDLRYQQRHEAQQNAVQAALISQEKATQAAMIASKEAVEKAEKSTDSRLTLLNELRGSVPTKEQFDALTERFGDLKERLDKLEGSGAGKNKMWSYALGAATLVSSIMAIMVIIVSATK